VYNLNTLFAAAKGQIPVLEWIQRRAPKKLEGLLTSDLQAYFPRFMRGSSDLK